MILYRIIMIRNKEKRIIKKEGVILLEITRMEIEKYLNRVKVAVEKDNYRIEINKNRSDNRNLFVDYVLSEVRIKEILLSLTVDDFSERRKNNHKGFEKEILYIFGKEIKALERFGEDYKAINLYIKLNLIADDFVFVISFHEQKYPLYYYFK